MKERDDHQKTQKQCTKERNECIRKKKEITKLYDKQITTIFELEDKIEVLTAKSKVIYMLSMHFTLS